LKEAALDLAGQLLIGYFNRDRDTEWAEVATAMAATRKKLREAIAVALPNIITRKRPPRQRLRSNALATVHGTPLWAKRPRKPFPAIDSHSMGVLEHSSDGDGTGLWQKNIPFPVSQVRAMIHF